MVNKKRCEQRQRMLNETTSFLDRLDAVLEENSCSLTKTKGPQTTPESGGRSTSGGGTSGLSSSPSPSPSRGKLKRRGGEGTA